MKYPVIFISLLFCCRSVAFSQPKFTERIYLGVMETKNAQWPEERTLGGSDTATVKIVRVLFVKLQDQWQSLEQEFGNPSLYPDALTWTISFDGKSLGKVHSEKAPIRYTETPWTFPRDGHHRTMERDLPAVGSPTTEFTGWPGDIYPRPLIVSTASHCADPQHWKPFDPHPSVKEELITACSTYLEEWESFDMQLLKSYKSDNNDQLINIGLFTAIEGKWIIAYNTWFYKSANGMILNLSGRMNQKFCQDDFTDDDMSVCTLVDAGDYDGDGQSEVVFWTSRYNGDGYVLFYNNFKEMSGFTWGYH